MAGRIVVMTNSDTQIKGNCEATGYADYLKLDRVTFGSNGVVSRSEVTGEVYQSSIDVIVPMGPWIAELEAAMYAGKTLGSVTITELAQVADTNAAKTWKKVRELVLTDGWIESMTFSWSGIDSGCNMTLNYQDYTFTWGDKVAHYNKSEKTS